MTELELAILFGQEEDVILEFPDIIPLYSWNDEIFAVYSLKDSPNVKMVIKTMGRLDFGELKNMFIVCRGFSALNGNMIYTATRCLEDLHIQSIYVSEDEKKNMPNITRKCYNIMKDHMKRMSLAYPDSRYDGLIYAGWDNNPGRVPLGQEWIQELLGDGLYAPITILMQEMRNSIKAGESL
jgi:hypothetical protein